MSRSKGNQSMKFGQLLEYNKRNTFPSEIMEKMRQGDCQDFSLFLKQLYMR